MRVGKPLTLSVRSERSFQVFDVATETCVATVQGCEITFAQKTDGIEVLVDGCTSGPFKGPLRLIPEDKTACFEITSPKVRDNRYRHILEINGGNGLSVVNELPIEDYVAGVVPVEIPASWHPEAQKAHAVAIRTYALRSMDRHKSSGYNVCDNTHCQGFAGASRDAEWVQRVVRETVGQVVTYDGKPVVTPYSTDCGGVTQNNEDAGFGKDPWPYLRSVADNPNGSVQAIAETVHESGGDEGVPEEEAAEETETEDYCAGSPHHRWTLTYTIEELEKKLCSSPLVGSQAGKIESIQFADYNSSDRVKTVIIKGDRGEVRISGNDLRNILGHGVIKATRMTLSATPEGSYVIEGRGYGHGVGMCSFGANGLAKAGKDYISILKHYYTGVEIKQLWRRDQDD